MAWGTALAVAVAVAVAIAVAVPAVAALAPARLADVRQQRELAEPATKGSIAAARRKQEAAERAVVQATQKAEESAALLNKTVLTIAHQAGEDGRLFGSVTSQDIVDAIREARGIRIDRRRVHLDEPIRNVGTRMVVVEVADNVTATVKTMVVEQK